MENGKAIIILDDDVSMREMFELRLKRNLREDLDVTDIEIHGFKDGIDALEFLNDNNELEILAICSDNNMLQMDGPEFCKEIKKTHREKVPFCFLTANRSFGVFQKLSSDFIKEHEIKTFDIMMARSAMDFIIEAVKKQLNVNSAPHLKTRLCDYHDKRKLKKLEK